MLTAWNAFSSLDRLIENVMDDVMTSGFGTTVRSPALTPPVDIRTNEGEIVFSMDLPGIKKEDLEVVFENGVLTVQGERKYEYGQKDKVWLGRGYGRFSRSFTVPEGVDADGLSAKLQDGVLTVRLPKQPSAQPRRIQIESGGGDPKQLTEKS